MLALVSVDSDEEEAPPSSSSPWVVSERSDEPLSNLSGGSGFSDISFGFCRMIFGYCDTLSYQPNMKKMIQE